MPVFGKASKEHLSNLHPDLVRVLNAYIAAKWSPDIKLTDSYRDERYQNTLYAIGRTRPGSIVTNARYGDSPHNYKPALAFDFVPMASTDYKDRSAFAYVAGQIVAVARGMGIDLVWGGDFDRDGKTEVDFPHIQMANWKEIVKNGLAQK